MQLAFRANTKGWGAHPLILLHGLLGSSQNWVGLLSRLEGTQTTYALDLRNHGQSPHAPEMNFPLMVEDVLLWMQAQGISKAHLLGHSLGGKIALQLACRFEPKIVSLSIIDIAPKAYPPHHQKIFDALSRLPLNALGSRKDADVRLAQSIEDPALRAFLLTNLARNQNGSFFWQPNLEAISETKNVEEISQNPVVKGDRYHGPCWWLKGGDSPYIRDKDYEAIKDHAPLVQFEVWDAIGHNPHTQAPQRFQERLCEYLTQWTQSP